MSGTWLIHLRVGHAARSPRARRALVAAVATLAILAVAQPVLGQAGPSSQALFLETIRDPGDTDVPPTARTLAMGGFRLAAGWAEDASTSPATLTLGAPVEVVLAGGALFYWRDELVETPDRYPPRSPGRQRSDGSSSMPLYAALAVRRPTWAVAAFYDASARIDHDFDTARTNIYFAALQGTFVSEDGTGKASLSHRVSRLGGAVSFATRSQRLGVGLAVSAVRLDYEASARVHVDGRAAVAGGPVMHFTADEDTRAHFDGWGPGIVIGGMVRPVTGLTLAGRWEYSPTFDGTRTSLRESDGVVQQLDEAIRFRLPSTYGFGATFTTGGTIVSGELARTSFSDALAPVVRTSGSDPCNTPKAACPGWAIANYEAADATSVRGGIEQAIPVGGSAGTLLLRGGLAYQTAYTVARPTDDPDRNDGSLPAPPYVGDEEPPRQSALWITAGVGYRWSSYELAFGAGRSQTQSRLLLDFRFSR